jgi:DNA-binding response OmpR family regulator
MPETIALLLSNPDTSRLLEAGILRPAGYLTVTVADGLTALDLFKVSPPDLLIFDDAPPRERSHPQDGSLPIDQASPGTAAASDEARDCLELASELLKQNPLMPILLLPRRHSDDLEMKALRMGTADYLAPPIHANEVLQSVRNSLQRQKRLKEWIKIEMRRSTRLLTSALSGLEALQRIGRSVTAVLDLDSVLEAVVDAAVELTGRKRAACWLLDENTEAVHAQRVISRMTLSARSACPSAIPCQDRCFDQVSPR